MEHFFLPGVQNFFPIVSITCCHVKEIAAGVHKTNKVASPLVAFHVLVTITLTEVLDSTANCSTYGVCVAMVPLQHVWISFER